MSDPDATKPPPRSSLPEAARPGTQTPGEGSDAAPRVSAVGTTLNDNYRVDRLIGEGGMGEVYEGEHLFTGNRVAIKMILQELSKDEAIVGLFRREARILFDLADESIVRYLDSFYHAGTDRYCLVMQFIDGTPLADILERDGAMPLAQVVALMRRLALGLDKAHALGVTHRDLSPDNVMLPEGQVEHATIIDFGIATAEDKGEATLFGRFAGKYKYVAPEQLGLFKGKVGPWTDIYGLGLLIAAACRGKGLDMGASFPDAVQAREEIPDLSSLPPRLQPLLERMLQPSPSDRPASMAEVAAMLDDPRLLTRLPAADRTVIAVPPGQSQSAPSLSTPPGSLAPKGSLGGTSGLGQPAPARPTLSEAPTDFGAAPPQVAASRRGGGMIALVLIAAILAVGGWMLSQRPALWAQFVSVVTLGSEAPSDAPDPEPAPGEAVQFTVPPPDASTREGFLAGYRSDEMCTYATRITAGANVGRIAQFARSEGALSGLTRAYGDAFGLVPDVVQQPVSEGQCAVLALLRATQGRGAVAPSLVLDTEETQAGGTVLGRVGDLRGRGIWLALITVDGQVFDLSDRLEAQADGSLLFGFQLSAAPVATPQPKLLLALASPDPLVAAATAVDGVQAADLFARLLPEAVQVGAAGQVARFVLVP